MSTSEKYDRLAEGFSEREYADPLRYAARRARLVVELGPRLLPGHSVLDLGCGDGSTAGPLLAHGLRYTGVDASPEMVEAARRREPGVEFVAALAEEFEPAEPVDATICLRSFYYPEDRLAFFQRIASYTRLKFVFDFRLADDPAEEILADLRTAGFSSLELRPFFLPQLRRLPEAAVPFVYAFERSGPLASVFSRTHGRTFCSASREPESGRYQVEVASNREELERLAPGWSEIPWEREEVELEYFLARVTAKEDVIGPFAIVVRRGGEPVAALAARLETRRFQTQFGYRVVYAPHLRVLQVAEGGLVAVDPDAIQVLLTTLREALTAGTADVAAIPPLRLDSPLFAALGAEHGRFEQQRFLPTWSRRRLVLPATFDDYLASRSWETRRGIRKTANRLNAAHGDELSVVVLSQPADHERMMRDLERIARTTYQREAGIGFADTPEQRRLGEVGLEHGWVRAYVLYLGEEPIAFWYCGVYQGTMVLKTTGFHPRYLRQRVGVYLLMRLIEHACEDGEIRVIDFGPGDADYKQSFSNESWTERNLELFAPSFRARRINGTRTAILGAARVGRQLTDATHLTRRMKARWRAGLRR